MPERNFVGMRVTVLGAARSGKAVARLLKSAGARVFLSERSRAGEGERAFVKDLRIESEFGGHSSRVLDAEMIVVSPGVPSGIPVLREARARGIAICSEVEVASWFCHAPIVAITGSNGKTTTSSLVDHILDTPGLDYVLAGNIGEAFSDFVSTVDDTATVILEVSGFQLDHSERFKPEVYNYGEELVRNAVTATLDRKSMAGYGFSQEAEPETGALVRDHDDPSLPARRGVHNSLAAAMADRVMEVRAESIRESLMTFEGVRHRLELIRELDNVHYVNDSKATNINAVWYALESYDARLILIAGGRDKGNDYSEIADLVRRKVHGLVAIGESADRVLSELGHLTSVHIRAESMDEAVREARRISRPGDVVLLSPACASFDMFANFEERGDAFRRAVKELKP
ncbi:MAG: Mur ligase family protein [Rhodothermia bacterium]